MTEEQRNFTVDWQQEGPVPETHIKGMVEDGNLNDDTVYCREEMTSFLPTSDIVTFETYRKNSSPSLIEISKVSQIRPLVGFAAMKEKIKGVSTYILGLAIFICIMAIAVLFIWGGVWLSTKILPWLNLISLITLAIIMIIILPLSFFRKTRSFSGVCMVFASYIFGINVWLSGLLITYVLWGVGAILIGLFLMGIGVVPIAMLAMLFNAMWLEFGLLILFTLLTFGVRIFGYYLVEKAEEYSCYET